jgi:hypothetical protein
MSNTRSDALRAQWRLLQSEHADLVQKTEALHGSGDGNALREHTQRLHAHVQRLHALMEALEEHHKTSGPIGGLSLHLVRDEVPSKKCPRPSFRVERFR